MYLFSVWPGKMCRSKTKIVLDPPEKTKSVSFCDLYKDLDAAKARRSRDRPRGGERIPRCQKMARTTAPWNYSRNRVSMSCSIFLPYEFSFRTRRRSGRESRSS